MEKSGDGWLSDDTLAVSNVIGVILLIAITVALAGTFTAFFLGFDENVESVSPTFSTTGQYDDSMTDDGQRLVLEHQAGEKVNSTELTVIVRDARWQDTSAGTSGGAEYTAAVFEDQITDEFSASKSIELNRTHFEKSGGGALTGSTYLDLSDATVLIRWENPDPDEDRTDLLVECEVSVADACGGV